MRVATARVGVRTQIVPLPLRGRVQPTSAPDSVVVERLEASVAEGRLQLLPRDRPAAIAAEKRERNEGKTRAHARDSRRANAKRISRACKRAVRAHTGKSVRARTRVLEIRVLSRESGDSRAFELRGCRRARTGRRRRTRPRAAGRRAGPGQGSRPAPCHRGRPG